MHFTFVDKLGYCVTPSTVWIQFKYPFRHYSKRFVLPAFRVFDSVHFGRTYPRQRQLYTRLVSISQRRFVSNLLSNPFGYFAMGIFAAGPRTYRSSATRHLGTTSPVQTQKNKPLRIYSCLWTLTGDSPDVQVHSLVSSVGTSNVLQ